MPHLAGVSVLRWGWGPGQSMPPVISDGRPGLLLGVGCVLSEYSLEGLETWVSDVGG